MDEKVIIVTAPSGAGKTTLVRHAMLQFDSLEFSVSATTRPSRNGEVNGIDYHFLSPEEFKACIAAGEFVEWEEVYEGKLYGTLKSEVDKIWKKGKVIVFDVDVLGAISLKHYFRDKALAVFIKPPSIDVLRQRLMLRDTESKDTLEERLERATMEIQKEPQFDKVIVNDDLNRAKEELEETIRNFLVD